VLPIKDLICKGGGYPSLNYTVDIYFRQVKLAENEGFYLIAIKDTNFVGQKAY